MDIQLPHTIENCLGEKIVFKTIVPDAGGDKLIVEAFCTPGAGPAMHVHYKQDEALTVRRGKMRYQVRGEEPVEVGPGETALFKRGTPHKFWNSGDELLEMDGWIQPANSVAFFLSALYEAQNASGKGQPEAFAGAYLLTRYKSEYGLTEMPAFVRSVIIPITYFIGRLSGKYKRFEGAPAPLK